MPASILQAVCTVLPPGGGGPSPTPTATFAIARFDTNTDDELVAPVACWFTPTSITGFRGVDGEPITEPAGDTNVLDPTATEVFWSWDFGDPGYEPLVPSNLPAALRDVNRAYSKRPCHVFHAPGVKTVNLYGYDTQGNWGTAQFVFGPSGDAPAIADPATHFAGREVYFSIDGIFPAGSDPADRCTTVSAVNSRLATLWSGGVTFARLRLRRGEEYVEINGDLGNFRNLYIDSYGDPADPPPKQIRLGTAAGGALDGPFAISNGATGSPRIIDQDWQGPYDATTETGKRVDALIRNSSRNGRRHLIHRVRISGASFYHDNFSSDAFRVFSDVLITNWQDYGIFINSGGERLSLAILGGDFAQHVDALSGTDHGTGNSNFASLTNRHGPVRLSSMTRDLYVACASFFSRNGWSSRSGAGSGNTNPPTLMQACFRHGGSDSASWRNYATWERCSFEAGAGGVHFVDLGAQEPSIAYVSNVLFESNIFVASRDSETLATGKGRGMSARNNYFFVPAVPHIGSPDLARHQRMINWRFDGAVDPTGPSRVFIANNTGYILANNDQIGDTARVLANVAPEHNPVIENDVLFAPNLSPALGGSAGSTPILSGFSGRYKGTRFNFPPIGHPSMVNASTPNATNSIQPYWSGTTPIWHLTLSAFRVGGPGDIADGESIAVPYPDYTGKNNGALGQVTRAMVESALPGGGVRYHQMSVMQYGEKAMAPADANGDGRISVSFTDTHIVVTNNSGVTWPGASAFWILLDLRDRLMDYVPGTANPVTLPLAIASAGGAIPSVGQDLLRRWRGGKRDEDGNTSADPNYAGAVAGPLPV